MSGERTQPRPRFKGHQLSQEDQRALRQREREGPLGMLVARRIQALRLLDKGWTITQAAEATGTYRREVRRVANRFLEGGVEHALSEEPRRRPNAALHERERFEAFERWLAERYTQSGAPWHAMIRVFEGTDLSGLRAFVALWDEFRESVPGME